MLFRPAFRCVMLASLVYVSPLLSANIARADEVVTLRYSFKPGEQTAYRGISKIDQEMSGGMFGDNGMKSLIENAVIWKQTVKSAAADAASVEVVYRDLKMRMDIPMQGSAFFDSSSPEFKAAKPDDMDPLVRMMAVPVGRSVTLTLDQRGQISKVEKSAEFKAMAKELAAQAPMGERMFEQMFGDESMRKIFQGLYVVLPDKPVKPGYTWTASMTANMSMGGAIRYTTVWTYTGSESVDGHVMAKLTGQVSLESVQPEPGAKTPEHEGMDMQMVVKDGKGVSTAIFDPAAGQVRSVTTRIDMPGTMTMKGPGMGEDGAQGVTLNIKSVINTTATLVAADAPLDPDNAVKKPETRPAPRRRTPSPATPEQPKP
jgi:hypothetical protein